MNYSEKVSVSKEHKEIYLHGINKLIEKRQKDAEAIRYEYAKDILKNQGKYRDDLKKMFGWPLSEKNDDALPPCTGEKLSQEEGYSIHRLHFEVLPGVILTGLFFKNDEREAPLVIVQHGGQGTPEEVCGVYGSSGTYNDMLHRVRNNGVHVFAPQLLLWSSRYGVEFDRKEIDARLKRVGSSITAIELYAIKRIIDYFESQSYVSTFGMVGLSYGGFYTLCTAAIDTRIKSAISCSFFNKRDSIPWSDWTWLNSAQMFDDAEIACLVYPRKLCIELGTHDELFDYTGGVESFEKVQKLCIDVGTDWINLHIFEGEHEFCKDDDPIKKLIEDIKQ